MPLTATRTRGTWSIYLLPGTACKWQFNFKYVLNELAQRYHIIIDSGEFPIRILLNISGVVLDLSFITCSLLIAVRNDMAVCCDSALWLFLKITICILKSTNQSS